MDTANPNVVTMWVVSEFDHNIGGKSNQDMVNQTTTWVSLIR